MSDEFEKATPRPWSVGCVQTRIGGHRVLQILGVDQKAYAFVLMGQGEEQKTAMLDARLIVAAVNERDALRAMLHEVMEKGLIYWEPNTSRGHVSKAEMLARIRKLLEDENG